MQFVQPKLERQFQCITEYDIRAPQLVEHIIFASSGMLLVYFAQELRVQTNWVRQLRQHLHTGSSNLLHLITHCCRRVKQNPVVFCRYLPPETQVVLVSATLPHEVLEMTNKFMTDPVRVLVKRDELTLEVN